MFNLSFIKNVLFANISNSSFCKIPKLVKSFCHLAPMLVAIFLMNDLLVNFIPVFCFQDVRNYTVGDFLWNTQGCVYY
jgi:hypothetical protein